MSRNVETEQAESLAAESEQMVELTKQFLTALQRSTHPRGARVVTFPSMVEEAPVAKVGT